MSAALDCEAGRRPGRNLPGRLLPGATFTLMEFVTAAGNRIRIPDGEHIVHLQFRRFAGCPVCAMHLNTVARRQAEIVAVGVREVVLFYSTAEDIRKHTAGLPFDFIADPDRHVYLKFGVHSHPRALLDPRAWRPIAKAIGQSFAAIMRGAPVPPLHVRGGRFGLPADVLIARDGRVIASKYGAHVNDHWSVDQLLAQVRSYERR